MLTLLNEKKERLNIYIYIYQFYKNDSEKNFL